MLEGSPTKPYYEVFDLCKLFSTQDNYEYLYDEDVYEVVGEKENVIYIAIGIKRTLEKAMLKKNP